MMKLLGMLALALTFTVSAPPGAQAAPNTDADADSQSATNDDGIRLAMHPGPPHYHQPRRAYPRRPVRRVYRPPAYVPQPRRPVESFYRPRFHFGIGVLGNSVLDDDDTDMTTGLETGGGFELNIGWRLSSRFGLDLGWMASFHDASTGPLTDDAMLSAFTFDVRYFLTDWNQRMQPYISLGVGAYMMARDRFEFDAITGPGFQLGGGVDIYLTKAVSIGGKLTYRGAYMDNGDEYYAPTESAFVSSFSYGGDVKFHF